MRGRRSIRPLRVVLGAAALCASLFFGSTGSAAPVTPAVTLAPALALSATGTALGLQVTGDLAGVWTKAHAVLVVLGPGSPRDDVASLPVAAQIEKNVGDLSGSTRFSLTVPAGQLTKPGAYLATLTLTATGVESVQAQVWLGRVDPLQKTVDLVLVLPVAVGVHRDPAGVFVDDVVQALAVPNPDASGSLYAYFDVARRFPDLHLTLGVEPLLLDQLRSQAGGFKSHVDGQSREVAKDGPEALQAAQALVTFKAIAGTENVLVVPGPYAFPDQALLAREGWADGLDQMLLGKQTVESVLGLSRIANSGYAPGLEVTTDSLRFLSGASIDHTVVAAEVVRDLVETPPSAGRPVRARDRENGRLTLFFADERLRSLLAAPWSADRFFATLAAELAEGNEGPFVVPAADDYALPPSAFLTALGAGLAGNDWVHTLTLDELALEDPPSSRPIFLSRYTGFSPGFIGKAFADRLSAVHAAASDYLGATISDRAPSDRLRLLLYAAESRYWTARGADPAIANVGLSYLASADALVKEEFDKVEVAGGKSVIVMGSEGDVPVAVSNQTGYPLDVELVFEGAGLQVLGGARRKVTLAPSENIFSFRVKLSDSGSVAMVKVVAGSTLIDEGTVTVRAISAWSVLPWVAAGFAAIGILGGLVVWARRR